MSGPARKGLLGERLKERGLISADQLKIALIEQRRSGQQLGETLVALGFITEATLREQLSETLGAQNVTLGGLLADRDALAMISKEAARRHGVFPVSFDAATRELSVAIGDVNDIVAIDQVRAHVGQRAELRWLIAASGEIQRAIEQYYDHDLSIDGILHEIETGRADLATLSAEQAREYSHPVVRLIDALLTDAVVVGASDIHFEPESHFIRIRYRVDGVLRQVRALHRRYWAAMLVRLKILSGMNIAENRAPQDGRISLTLAGRDVDFRAAAHPTVHGENFVLRILDRKAGLIDLEAAGFSATQLAMLKLMLARPEGLLLLTGPTGSGKTTTLYSILNHRSTEHVNVMTLEDPVEYTLPLVRQSSVSQGAKLGFGDGIRSLMRQDPDIILVGEVRDRDTAEMALRAAMTGHQVLSTLHTNSALRSIPRLLDLGIQPETIAGNLIGIVAQRLVRRLCEDCAGEAPADGLESRILSIEIGVPLRRAAGCAKCAFTGYRGRIAIVEMVRFGPALDELVARRATLVELQRAAEEEGMVPLAQDGLRRVREGVTTIEEIGRVVDLTELVHR